MWPFSFEDDDFCASIAWDLPAHGRGERHHTDSNELVVRPRASVFSEHNRYSGTHL